MSLPPDDAKDYGHPDKVIGTFERQHHRFKKVSDADAAKIDKAAGVSTPMELRSTIDALEKENFDLVAKCISLINKLGWDAGRTFTFPDGDRWNEFKPEFPNNPEDSKHE